MYKIQIFLRFCVYRKKNICIFALVMETKRNTNGGRPHTDRVNRMNIVLSDEATQLLAGQKNKSAFIDALIRGEIAQVKCPKCGEVFTIKTEE